MSKKNLDKLIEQQNEAEIDKSISKIFKLSADMKEKMHLVQDFNGFNNYYIFLSDNLDYVKKINKMSNKEVEVLYSALKHPVLFVDLNSDRLDYFCEIFDGLTPGYELLTKKMEKGENDRLFERYAQAKKIDNKRDLEYARMYHISYKIKKEGVLVVYNGEETPFEFYLVESSKLGKDQKKIMDYLNKIEDEEAARFISISDNFSIVDTEKGIVYAIETRKDKDGKDKLKFSSHENRKEFSNLYKILDEANKNPNIKVFDLDQQDYSPTKEAPSDMYR